jgi:hypothetical protein
MVKRLLPLACLAAITIPFLSSRGQAQDVEVSANYDVFYDRLAPEGHWFYDDDYGNVWQPNVASDSDWRPYSDGHWVWTDRGWCWVSNEDFGWATYHYGRWVRVSDVGWVWVPGDEWAPAWVSWRQSDDNDYCGWAPLPPECTVSAGAGVSSWCDSYFDIGPIAFTFIRFHDFWRPSYRGYYVPAQQNVTIINRTTNITNITYNNTVINNYGPQYQTVAQITQQQGHPLQTYKVNYAAQTQPNAGFKTAVQGNQVNVVAPPPKLNPVATKQPPVTKQLAKAQVDRGWQNVPAAQAQQLKQKFAQQAPPPANLPPKPAPPPKPQIQAAGAQPGVQPASPQPGQPGKPGTVQQPPAGATPQAKPGAAQLPSPAAKPGQPGKPVTAQQPPAGATPQAKPGATQLPSPSPAAKPGAAQQRSPLSPAEPKQTPASAQQAPKAAGTSAAEQQRAEAEKAKAQDAQKGQALKQQQQEQAQRAQEAQRARDAQAQQAQEAQRAREAQLRSQQQAASQETQRARDVQQRAQEAQRTQEAQRARESQQRPPQEQRAKPPQEPQRPAPQREARKEQRPNPQGQKQEEQQKREQPPLQ